MNSENNEKEEQIVNFMSELARQDAQLKRGFDRMAFIAGAVVGLFFAAQATNILSWIVLPLLFGGFFVVVRKASSR